LTHLKTIYYKQKTNKSQEKLKCNAYDFFKNSQRINFFVFCLHSTINKKLNQRQKPKAENPLPPAHVIGYMIYVSESDFESLLQLIEQNFSQPNKGKNQRIWKVNKIRIDATE